MRRITKTQKKLLMMARERDGPNILPIQGSKWNRCFSTYKGIVMLWYNIPNGSTHVVKLQQKAYNERN